MHVNPRDEEVLDWALRRQSGQVALVTGDPGVQRLLRRAAAGKAGVQVIDAVVAAQASAAQWLRFNVSEVDGLLEPAALHQVYPRLQMLERLPVRTLDLSAVLALLPCIKRQDGSNVLVLELPGLELSVLQSLPDDQLQLFDWILLRCAKDGLYELGAKPSEVSSHLQARFYESFGDEDQSDPLWPLALFRFDESAATRDAWARRVGALEQQLAQVEQSLGIASRELERQSRLAAEHLGQVQVLRADCEAAVAVSQERQLELQRLTHSFDELTQVSQGQLAEMAALAESRDAAGERVKQHLIELEEANKVRDAAVQLARDRLAQLDQTTKARDEQVKLAADRAAQLQALTQSAVQSERLSQDRLKQIEQLTKSRDEQTRITGEQRKRLLQLESQLVELTARDSLLQEELLKAEAHVELISELVFREPLR